MTRKPHLFIGSSVEGLAVAEAIQVNLEYNVISTIWSQGVFGLSSGTLESLVKALKDFDFSVLVLTPDDMLVKRDQSFSVARDNVLFELGLFVGYLGRERTFIVHPRDKPIHLPTDLAGITAATYETPVRQTLQAALGAVCTKIKSAVSNAPPRVQMGGDSTNPTIYTELRELRSMVATLIGSSPVKVRPAHTLKILEGAWNNEENGSWLYCQVVADQAWVVYCYTGNDEATGEYYSWQLINNELFSRFRWFEDDISGYVWLRIETPDLLEGGWWYADSVEETATSNPTLLKNSRGMNPYQWRRRDVAKYPAWAERYFSMKMKII